MSFRILMSPERVVVAKNLEMQPFVRYVLPAGPAQAFAKGMAGQGVPYEVSNFNSYYRPYGGADLNGKRIAVYRHAAFGDILMVTSVAVYLKHLWPNALIDVYCPADMMPIWAGLPVRVFKAPFTLEAAKAYDWHLFYDQMLEENREQDQANAYDDMFAFAGVRDVADVFKRPKVVPLESDLVELTAVLRARDCKLPEKFLLYQLGAGNQNRSYPPAQGGEFIAKFLDAHPDWSAVVVGVDKGKILPELMAAADFPLQGRIINLVDRLRNFRSLIPLVVNAGLVVCPDSSIGHLAAAFPDVPVISLWGLFSPADRVKYYPNHFPLWPKAVCPHAPCRSHEFTLPQAKCYSATNAPAGEQRWCNVLRAIPPEGILAKAQEILTNFNPTEKP